MPATSAKVTVCCELSTRLARERPNCASTPPPPAPAAARRANQTNSAHQQDGRAEAEQDRLEKRALAGRLRVHRHLVLLEERRQGVVVGEGRDLGLEVLRLVALVGDLLLELALHRVALGGDLLDVAGLDLGDEGRGVGHPDHFLGRREDLHEQPVHEEQDRQDRHEAAQAERQHRLALRRRPAAVGRRAHPPRALRGGRRPGGGAVRGSGARGVSAICEDGRPRRR